ncbi:MAG: HAD family hydrolase [Candidatus Binatia bacterium]
MSGRYRAILFDLFGTLVHFTVPPDPDLEWLRAPLARACPGVELPRLRDALWAVTRELAAERPPEYYEVPSQERFRRALARLGVADLDAAEALSAAHMDQLELQTAMPAGYRALLADWAAHYRLGVISNFDHGPTARAVVARFDPERRLAVAVISADFGRRKPHASIFTSALRQLDVSPAQALFVGDNHAEDIVGAIAIGMDAAWITRDAAAAVEPAPTYVLPDLPALAALLGARSPARR